ncbi:MAG: TonB-dependent receptor, partial [Pseudomonadota bacterium]|nr:TonB-dependent receptor [Pseudomonadota bacterium]
GKAEEWNSGTRTIGEYPKGGADAFNWQVAGIWRYSDSGQWYASVSDRARFPTIFELYSTRFGSAVPNPNLGAERATNYELGWQGEFGGTTTLSGALFYNDVERLIQTVQVGPGLTQTQNVGNGEYYGVELSIETRLSPQLVVGANYTYMDREIEDSLQPNLQATGVPDNKAFVYMTWSGNRFSITPSIDIADDRWSDISTNPAQAFPFVRTGSYMLVNLQAEYQLLANVDLSAGVKNLSDENYELSWGLPMQGRTFYVKTRLDF